jgi:hypothetical protein
MEAAKAQNWAVEPQEEKKKIFLFKKNNELFLYTPICPQPLVIL